MILAGGGITTLSATLVEDGANDNDGDPGSPPPFPSGQTIKLSLGTQSCTGTTNSAGNASCNLSSVVVPLGPEPVKAEFAGAGPLVEQGMAVAVANYDLCPAVSIAKIVDGKLGGFFKQVALLEKKAKCPLCGAKNPVHAARCGIAVSFESHGRRGRQHRQKA